MWTTIARVCLRPRLFPLWIRRSHIEELSRVHTETTDRLPKHSAMARQIRHCGQSSRDLATALATFCIPHSLSQRRNATKTPDVHLPNNFSCTSSHQVLVMCLTPPTRSFLPTNLRPVLDPSLSQNRPFLHSVLHSYEHHKVQGFPLLAHHLVERSCQTHIAHVALPLWCHRNKLGLYLPVPECLASDVPFYATLVPRWFPRWVMGVPGKERWEE